MLELEGGSVKRVTWLKVESGRRVSVSGKREGIK